ncbi:MFS transporter [Shigella flexneri]
MADGLATFSVPFLIRPLGGLSLGCWVRKWSPKDPRYHDCDYVDQYVLYWLIPSYDTIGIWDPFRCRFETAQGFWVAGADTGVTIAGILPHRKRGFMGSGLDFGSIAGFGLGAGVVVLISTIVGEANFLDWGWRIPSYRSAEGLSGFTCAMRWKNSAFQQHVDKLEQGDREGLQDGRSSSKEIATKHWRSLST